MPATLQQQIDELLSKTSTHGATPSKGEELEAYRDPNSSNQYAQPSTVPVTKQYATSNGNLGVSQTKPTILYVADFVPLFENGTLNNVGMTLANKEMANVISAKNAIMFLGENPESLNTYLRNGEVVKNLVSEKSVVISSYLQKLRKINDLLNLKMYKLDGSGAPDIIDILTESKVGGFAKKLLEDEYSQTKLWSTFMWRFYHACESYIGRFPNIDGLPEAVSSSQYDDDEFLIDLSDYRSNERVWLNSRVFNFKNDLSDATNIRKKLFKKINSSVEVDSKVLSNYHNSIAPIAFLSIILSKELRYSIPISGNAQLESAIGNTSTFAEDKLLEASESPQKSLWKRYIGMSKNKNVLINPYKSLGSKVSDTPLLGFAYHYAEENINTNFEVRTFEQDFLDKNPISPGHAYFLDTKGAMNSGPDPSAGARIGNMQELMNKVTDAETKLQLISRMNSDDNANEDLKKYILPNKKIAKIVQEFKWLVKENYLMRQRYELRGVNVSVTRDFQLWQQNNFASENEKKGFLFSSDNAIKAAEQQRMYTALVNACVKNTGFLSTKKETLKDRLFSALYYDILPDENTFQTINVQRYVSIDGSGAAVDLNSTATVSRAASTTKAENSEGKNVTRNKLRLRNESVTINKYYISFLSSAFDAAKTSEKVKNLEVYTGKALYSSTQRLPLFYIDTFGWKQNNKTESLSQALFSSGGGSLNFARWGTNETSLDADDNVVDNIKHFQGVENFGGGFYECNSIATLRRLMREEYDFLASRCVSTSLMDRAATAYSRTQIKVYMYAYFELLLKVHASISSVVLEKLEQDTVYAKDQYRIAGDGTDDVIEKKSLIHTQIFGVFTLDTTHLRNAYTNFFSTDQKTSSKNGYFDWEAKKLQEAATAVDNQQAYSLNTFLTNAMNLASEESNITKKFIDIMNGYMSDLKNACSDLEDFIVSDLSAYIRQIQATVVKQDIGMDVEVNKKLRNDSISPEQLYLNAYIASEMKDKLEDTETFNKIKMIPVFSDIKTERDWSKLLPSRDLELMSFQCLSSFFKSSEFLKTRAHNAKILGIGIPPKLIRRIKERRGLSRQLQSDNILKIKVFKINRMYPDLVFLPQHFIFQANRFPTRVLKNWDIDKLKDDTYNLSEIPTKIYEADAKILLHADKSVADAYFDEKNTLVSNNSESNSVRENLYINHAKSFLLGEYIRWFTGMNFDEERYFHYNSFSNINAPSLQQKNAVLSSSSTTQPTGTVLMYTDSATGKSYYVPVSEKMKNSTAQATRDQIADVTDSVINVTDDVDRYFRNDTLLNGYWEASRKLLYAKKFDRVFNVLIDPDDFKIDTTRPGLSKDGTIYKSYLSKGLLKEVSNGVKMKEMSAEDIAFDEYFVTIESYNSVTNW